MTNRSDMLLFFRITLDASLQPVKNKPYRDIAILGNQSLSTFARAIASAFGFDFDHAYGFYDNLKDIFKSEELYELFTDLGEDPTPGAGGVERTKVSKAFPDIGKTMKFLFDYGDGWQFTVVLQDKKKAVSGEKYPKLITSYGNAPEQYPPLEEDDDEEYFDDCAICQGMKKTEEAGRSLSLEELKGLFDKQNKRN